MKDWFQLPGGIRIAIPGIPGRIGGLYIIDVGKPTGGGGGIVIGCGLMECIIGGRIGSTGGLIFLTLLIISSDFGAAWSSFLVEISLPSSSSMGSSSDARKLRMIILKHAT